jgi:phosphate transport system substrate-binding protein
MTRKSLVGLLAAVSTAVLTISAASADITGAGSTFVFPVMSKWAAGYKTAKGVSINYQSIGSGGGIKQIEANTVTFGASDMPLHAADLKTNDLIQFPIVVGGDVPVVNIPGIKPGELLLDGPTLAKIFLGEIKKWNDPQIKNLNPHAALPNLNILVVHRSDGSGTTFIWASYLSKVSPEWAKKVGADTAVEWPTGIGAKGNEGVSGNVQQVSGSIGYVEYAYARQAHLAYTRAVNAADKVVEPSQESFQAAAANADWAHAPGFDLVITNAPGIASWPISGSTFILIHKKPQVPADAATALKFFDWAYTREDDARSLDYVPMPPIAVQAVKASWHQVQGGGY